ncbi:hypothetical protein SPRG_17327 [Saprolegnia parasitica CBS 223.65]|uniref:Uncharacterized protein n=1 Tax=Saprolegnia parasitica (strain CBS 223.65) TaxID=695850 RepID=A0A067BGJ2_SAPPC|nr:hypothetical protein SPRG_17327 [Saprolegnia parasitica CBS 223.65]KDO17243.1 hypothetical protein SPRG_17327 [Saprolegnia parasitica CBS 223.65]|eukprot:XP_012212049.1 hypothetical protein SPRG_17327 [Saprolegnia parasitica CBS 223.65]
MSNAKRHAKAPTPVEALDHVQEAIVKCLETPDDVVAFLDALSPDALCERLAAFLPLLCEPGDDMWDADDEAEALVRLWPSFAGLDHVLIGILKWLKTSQEVLAFLEGIDTPTLGKPLVALLRLLRTPLDVMEVSDEDSALDKLTFAPPGYMPWDVSVCPVGSLVDTYGHKLTHLKIAYYYEEDEDFMCSLFRRCTSLDVVHVENPCDLAFVAAVTTPAHAVSSLSIVSSKAADEWAAVLEPWLQSGHAKHLRYQNLPIRQRPRGLNVGNARILAAASALSHLTVICDGVDPLVDATPMRFENLETLNMSVGHAGPFLGSVLDRVNPAVLTSLTIFCEDDIDFLLKMLPCFLALRKLKILGGVFAEDAQPPAAMARPLALTSLTLHDVEISGSSFLALDAFLANAPRLETLSFGSSYYRGESVASMLPGWIRNGVREIHLADCKYPKGFGSQVARALCGMTSPLGVTITLVGSTLSDDDYEALLDALATCTGVDLVLDPHWPQLAIEAAKRNLALDGNFILKYDFDEIQPFESEVDLENNYDPLPKGRCDAVRVMRRP